MPRTGSRSLSLKLTLASVGSAVAIGVVCVVGLVSLRNLAAETQSAATQQLTFLNESSAFESLLYQKGFLAEYMLTRDRAWLDQLELRRKTFAAWLASARGRPSTGQSDRLLHEIETEYRAYDATRQRAVALFDGGHVTEATALLHDTHGHTERLLARIDELGGEERSRAQQVLASSERSTRRLGGVLVATSVLGAFGSIAVGFLFARRFARPIYELRLRAESAVARVRLQVSPTLDDLDGLSAHVSALVRRVEDMDEAMADQRRRLVQSEKLSAIGELAAKLAHEILNPLAGMKAAAQLLARTGASGSVRPETVRETAEALDREITRVEQLVRHLVDYARPLAPRVAVCGVQRLIDDALDASRRELDAAGVKLHLRVADDLPPLEVDPLLVAQALRNLLCNAAQAMGRGGDLDLVVARSTERGRDRVVFEVGDSGPGIRDEDLPRLFSPFFTTKPTGHGLGLAVTQHIALEHGGNVSARNRGDRPGALFDLELPVVR